MGATKSGNWVVEGSEATVMAQAEKAVEAVGEDFVEKAVKEDMPSIDARIDARMHQLIQVKQHLLRSQLSRMSEMVADHLLDGSRGERVRPVPSTTDAIEEVSLLQDLLGCSPTTGIAFQVHDSILVESRVPTQEEIDKIREQFKVKEPEWALDWEDTKERWKQALQPRRMQCSRPNEPRMQNIPMPRTPEGDLIRNAMYAHRQRRERTASEENIRKLLHEVWKPEGEEVVEKDVPPVSEDCQEKDVQPMMVVCLGENGHNERRLVDPDEARRVRKSMREHAKTFQYPPLRYGPALEDLFAAMRMESVELPKSLGLVGTRLIDVKNWKEDRPHPPIDPEVEAQHRRDIEMATARFESAVAELDNLNNRSRK